MERWSKDITRMNAAQLQAYLKELDDMLVYHTNALIECSSDGDEEGVELHKWYVLHIPGRMEIVKADLTSRK